MLAAGVFSARAAEEVVSGPGGCPNLKHVPLGTVVRGQPAAISALVECGGGTVEQVTLFVRLTDLGKPTATAMSGDGAGLHKSVVPVSLVRGVSRFWYYIEAKAKNAAGDEEIIQTKWYPVNILDGADAGGGGGGGGHGALWALGAAGVAGAGYLIYDHNNDDDDNDNNGAPGNPPAPPTGGGSGGGDDEDGDETDESPECRINGFETAAVADGTACDDEADVRIWVCNTCPDAIIEAVGSWGVNSIETGYNNLGCKQSGPPALTLPPPPFGVEFEGQYTVSVLVNGEVIKVVPWPGDSYYDCF